MGSFVENVNKMASLTPTNVEDLSLIVQNIDAINQVAPVVDGLNNIVDNIIPNLAEILDADNNAIIATEQALLATTQTVIATEQATIATNQATTATTQAGIATKKAEEASYYATITNYAIVETLAELEVLDTTQHNNICIVKDIDRGGIFIWSSTGTTDNGITFAGSTGYWIRQYDGYVNVKWFDNIVDCASLGCELFLNKRTYNITSSINFLNTVIFEEGALLNISDGVTVTFSSGFEAPICTIFELNNTGAIISNMDIGYPEWFGANSTYGVDSLSAIHNTIKYFKKTVFQRADYFISSSIVISVENRILEGAYGRTWGAIGDSTRIVLTNGSDNIISVGLDSYPSGGINYFLENTTINNLHLTRSVAPVATSSCAGIYCHYTLYTFINNCHSSESMLGYHFMGTTQTHIDKCFAFRSTTGTGGTDFFYGYYLNGTNVIGSGGNASVYITECNGSVGGISPNALNSSGIYLGTNFADVYIDKFEASYVRVGINIQGNSTQSGNVDLIINNPVIDLFHFAGILIQNTSTTGAIEINGGYFAPWASANNTSWGIWVISSLAQLSIIGTQIIASSSSITGGIQLSSSSSVISKNNLISEVYQQGIHINNSYNCSFCDSIKNSRVSTNSAVYVGGTTNRCKFDCSIASGNGSTSFGLGYQIVGSSTYLNEYVCTMVNTSAISGGTTNKLNNNGTSITDTGTFGTNNLASGIML